MSQHAFDMMMSQLSKEDQKRIYAAATAYGLDFTSPEWIPFALSERGRIGIEEATEKLEKAVKGLDEAAEKGAQNAADRAEKKVLEKVAELVPSVRDDLGNALRLKEWRYVAIAVSVCLILLAAICGYGGYKLFNAGKAEGYSKYLVDAKWAEAAASWANTKEGRLAYQLYEENRLDSDYKLKWSTCGPKNSPCIKVNKKAGSFGKSQEWMIPE